MEKNFESENKELRKRVSELETSLAEVESALGAAIFESIPKLVEIRRNLKSEISRLEAAKKELLTSTVRGSTGIKPIQFEALGNPKYLWAKILLSSNSSTSDDRFENDNYNGFYLRFCYKVEEDTLEVCSECFGQISPDEIISEDCRSKDEAEVLTRLWVASVVGQFQGADWEDCWGVNSDELSKLHAKARAYIKMKESEAQK